MRGNPVRDIAFGDDAVEGAVVVTDDNSSDILSPEPLRHLLDGDGGVDLSGAVTSCLQQICDLHGYVPQSPLRGSSTGGGWHWRRPIRMFPNGATSFSRQQIRTDYFLVRAGKVTIWRLPIV
jgi:hypothetical protein